MEISPFIVMPLLAAALGYFTNWLAIKMLFRPHTAKRLFGVRLPFTPGLIPKEHKRLAKVIAKTVAEYLMTPDVLERALRAIPIDHAVESLLESPDFRQAVREHLPKIGSVLEHQLAQNQELDTRLKNLVHKMIDDNAGKLATLFINKDKVFHNIKAGLIDYVKDPVNQDVLWENFEILLTDENKQMLKTTLAQTLEKSAKHVANAIDIAQMVEEQINTFDMAEGERIVLSVIRRELYTIMALGGVLGFFIGFFMALL